MPVDVVEPGETEHAPLRPKSTMWPVYAMVAVALTLVAFVGVSDLAHPVLAGIFQRPPLYGSWEPVRSQLAWWTVPAAVALALLGVWFAGGVRRSWLALTLTVAAGVGAAAAVVLVRGRTSNLTLTLSTSPKLPYNTSDLHFADQLGVRGLFAHYTSLHFHSVHNKTHPPGTLAFLYVTFEVLGHSHALRVATLFAVLSMCAAVPAYWLGRIYGGPRAGQIAAVLLVAAPGPLLFAFGAMDAIYATLLAGAAATLTAATAQRSWRLAAVGGALLAITTMLTYATVFIALAAAIATILATRDVRQTTRLLGAAALAGMVTLAVLRVALEFNIVDLYQHLSPVSVPYQPYWIVGSPVAFWIGAGVTLAALGTSGVFMVARRKLLLPIVLLLLMFAWAALPASMTHLRSGEVERTWAFMYPMLAAGAGFVIDRWLPANARWSRWTLAALVVFSVAQAVLVEALWFNYF